MENPLISVIIPTFNRSELLLKAIESVEKQIYPNYEILICDDGSTDDTEQAVKPLINDKVRYLKQENKGPGAARNLGIKSSNGQLIAFLDSDDSWMPEHLSYVVEFFNLYPDADMVYTQNEVISDDGEKKKNKNSFFGFFFFNIFEILGFFLHEHHFLHFQRNLPELFPFIIDQKFLYLFFDSILIIKIKEYFG